MVRFFAILMINLLVLIALVDANWWFLGLKTSKNEESQLENNNNQAVIKINENLFEINKPKVLRYQNNLRKYCKNVRILSSPIQRKLCQKNIKLVDIMSKAAKSAIDECQYQFRFKRWNCSIFNKPNVFGGLIQTKSKETAFIYGIISAAAMYEVTRACKRGELKNCDCNNQLKQSTFTQPQQSTGDIRQYQWGGCSDNVLYGYKLSKQFVDSNEYSKAILDKFDNKDNPYLTQEYKLMNLHNNEVGRRTILKNMREVCKCHGVSGSCSVKVCWKVMPEFRKIGNELIKRYNEASQIKDPKIKNRVEKLMIINRRSTSYSKNAQPTYKDDFIFTDKSPNFCRRDKKLDTLGTVGRICSLTTADKAIEKSFNDTVEETTPMQSCDYLCCGRGYYSKVIELEEDCDCQFQWCCSVKCKKCKKKIIQYYCN